MFWAWDPALGPKRSQGQNVYLEVSRCPKFGPAVPSTTLRHKHQKYEPQHSVQNTCLTKIRRSHLVQVMKKRVGAALLIWGAASAEASSASAGKTFAVSQNISKALRRQQRTVLAMDVVLTETTDVLATGTTDAFSAARAADSGSFPIRKPQMRRKASVQKVLFRKQA